MPSDHYFNLANAKIDRNRFAKDPMGRTTQSVKDLLKKEYCIDCHTHFFDMHCINLRYFSIRIAKDFLGLRAAEGPELDNFIERQYEYSGPEPENWETQVEQILKEKTDRSDGRLDVITKILWMKKMEDLYKHYIKTDSLADYFNLPKENVLTSVLMMDIETGWETRVRKSFKDQITEVKELAEKYPVLPFLYCDPRRIINDDPKENLYDLFAYAFNEGTPFFGVKIYPALGYDPNDFRLWPIYAICEEFNIPVLTHCGGEIVSTHRREIEVFEGEELVLVKGANRKEVAYNLNDPSRWKPVLEQFPKLKLNFGHFGSSDTWLANAGNINEIDPQRRKDNITAMMMQYENVYSDFSYSITDPDILPNFKKTMEQFPEIRERTLFGSDYWVVYGTGDLKKKQEFFLDFLEDDDLVEDLVKNNPYSYFFE